MEEQKDLSGIGVSFGQSKNVKVTVANIKVLYVDFVRQWVLIARAHKKETIGVALLAWGRGHWDAAGRWDVR